ncbi:MAG: hypothetical protein ACJ71T_12635 [Actinomycetales bacterium]
MTGAADRRGGFGQDREMGTFTEVVLGFSFRPETPDHVLSAFSALAVPSTAQFGPPEPPLPSPHPINPDDEWEPTDEWADPALDPAPWRHDWATWFSRSTSVSITPSAQLMWSKTGRWTLSCRWGIKSGPEEVFSALRWLGPYLEGFDQRPILLGYMDYGGAPRPVLVWLFQGQLSLEDLNPPGTVN